MTYAEKQKLLKGKKLRVKEVGDAEAQSCSDCCGRGKENSPAAALRSKFDCRVFRRVNCGFGCDFASQMEGSFRTGYAKQLPRKEASHGG